MSQEDYENIGKTLDDAKAIVTNDREDTHGDVRENMGQIAELWSAYLQQDIDAVDVSVMMIMMKASRQKVGSRDQDHFDDIVGYGAIAGGINRTDSQ